MNTFGEKPNDIMITAIDTAESETLVNAICKIQTDLGKHMVLERIE